MALGTGTGEGGPPGAPGGWVHLFELEVKAETSFRAREVALAVIAEHGHSGYPTEDLPPRGLNNHTLGASQCA